MTAHDTGVTELLRRASDGLTPDVDRLVSGGITRGRSRQRRARIGTTVASLAVIGVVGGLAAVVPHLGGADSAPGPGFATDGGGVVASEAPTAEPPAPATTEHALADFDAREVHVIVNDILGSELAAAPRPTDTVVDDPDEKVAYFPYDGMQSAVGFGLNQRPTAAQCSEMNDQVGSACVEMSDGTVEQVWGPTLADGVTCQGASAYRYGYVVWATSCNAAEAKDSPALADQPPIPIGLLEKLVLSDAWFAGPAGQ